MNKREALLIMLEMWDYIALNGGTKQYAVWNTDIPEGMWENCSCCESVRYFGVGYSRLNCESCPILWPKASRYKGGAACGKSYFGLWDRTKTVKRARYYARKIANLALQTLNQLYPEDI